MKRELGIAFGIYVFCVGTACFFWERPVVVLVGFVLVGGLMLLRWHTRADLAAFLAAMVLGTIADVVSVSFGVWEYGAPLYLVPVWLPVGWGIIGLFLKRVSGALVNSGEAGNRSG
jgi:hypothetical protein